MTTNEYVTIYGVGLLDDLHNYFPELLYNSERFASVQQVLQYIISNVHNRFDLYGYGRSLYSRTPTETPAYSFTEGIRGHTPPQAQPPATFTGQQAAATVIADPLYSWIPIGRTNNIDENVDASVRLLTSLFTGFPIMEDLRFVNRVASNVAAGRISGEFMEPVVIRPTQEELARATSLETLTTNASNMCSICQEEMVTGEEVRTIQACTHGFHRRCIDTWFTRNVRCPVCRHDIRGSMSTPTATSPRSPPPVRRQGTFGRTQHPS